MNYRTLPHSAPVRPALMSDMARYGVVFDTEGVQPPESTPPAAPPKKDPPPQVPPAAPPQSDAEAATLRAQIAAMEAKLKGFGDATPDEIKELRRRNDEPRGHFLRPCMGLSLRVPSGG